MYKAKDSCIIQEGYLAAFPPCPDKYFMVYIKETETVKAPSIHFILLFPDGVMGAVKNAPHLIFMNKSIIHFLSQARPRLPHLCGRNVTYGGACLCRLV